MEVDDIFGYNKPAAAEKAVNADRGTANVCAE
jgi:hypothetical protein